MRVTRYLWINNLPDRVTEQDIRDVLQSHGKIQSVRIHEHEGNNGAVVAFVDTKSATRAVESTIRLRKVNLSLQYCESSGIPGTNSSDQLATPLDYIQTSNNSLLQSDVNYSRHKSRSVSTVSDSSSVFHDPENNGQTDICLSHTTKRNYPKDFKTTNMNASPRFQNEHRGLKISHLPLRSSDTNLREGLFHEYKKHGKITSVFVRGQDEERICIITFKKSEDAEKALASSKGKVFFGTPISVQPHEGLNSEDPDLCPPEHALNEYHPKATKTLFVGNLCSGTITQDELRRTFRGYGEIIEIDIKIQANQPGTSYAFIQYGDIKSVVRALKEQETVRVNGKPVKLGFGKSQPTNVVWLDNLSPTINEAFLTRQFGRYGQLTHVVLDRKSMRALLYFDNVEVAQHAVNETRNRALVGRKVQIDYAGYECQVAFMKKLSKHDSFGQVYENYKERLQEVLSLLPYGSVIPYLGDRQRYFGDNQRDHFASGNTKFSYRRSNCLRSSPVDHSMKYEQPSNRTRCGSSVSPHERSHQSSDRRRTFITSSPDDSKISGNLICSHSNRNSHHGKSDAKNVQSEDRSSLLSHRRHQHNQIPITLKSSRYLSHTEGKSNLNSRTHVDQSNLRSRGQLLEETDDISSGSFSSDFTNDDSFFETSLKHSNTSSECSAPTSKLPSHVIRDHVLNIDKRKNVDTDFSQKCSRSNHYEIESLDESSYSSSKKYTQKARESVSPHSRVASTRLSVVRSRTSSQHRSHWAIDRNSNLRQSSQECLEENTDQKHSNTSFHSRARTLLKLPDADSSSPNYSSTKSKRIMLSKVASTYRDVEYSGRANTSTISPISPDDAPYNESEEAYGRITNSACSDIPIGVKSHDTLTKLEMERAKLLRELSLLNNEVIGGSRGKTGSVTINLGNSNRKRAPSSLFVNDIPSPKLKCVENSSKCELVSIQSPTLTSDNLMSPGFRESVSSSHSIRLMTASHDSNSEISGSKQGVVDKNVFALAVDNHLNTSDVASSSRRNHLSKTAQGHDFQNIHSNSRSETMFPAIVTDGLNMSGSRQPALITSSPRMVIAPESTSPMIHISPPSSPMIMGKSSYASTLGTSLSSSVLTASTSGSIISSLANSSSRDPRLAFHHTQLSDDVPPPPPETFKLPLWVDTSPHTEIMISNSLTSSVARTQSPRFSKFLCDVESDVSIQDPSGCSLDERIRLLDVQLMKSEKARPTVDYSKFRIRRKAESNSTPQSTQINNPTQCTTGVSVPSCTPHSPVLTSTYSITTRCELGAIDMINSSLPVSCTSNIGSTSPILSNSTLLNLVKPADTSEFVKSMLSFSKPSPSTPCDTSNNMFSNEIATTNRHTVSIPLCQNSFLTRLPRSCVSNSLSATTFIQSSVSSCGKQKSPNNNRIHSNVCNVEHSSLSGAQPVGVATRMPSVKPFCGSDVLKPEDNLVGKGDTKFNTLKESVDYVEKCEPVILSNSLNNTSTEFNANLPSYVNDNQKCVDVSNKVGVHGVSPLLGSSNDFYKTSQKTPTYQTITCQKSSPRDDFVSSNRCKPTSLLNIPLANVKKTQKHDPAKPILDDFVFQNSLVGSIPKNNQLKKPHPDTPSSILPTKRKPSTTSESKEIIPASNADKTVSGNISLTKSKTQKIPCQSVSKKPGSASESSLKKHSVPNNKLQLTTDGNQSVFSSNNRSLFCPEKKPVSPHSKKRKSVRDFKKKVIDSEDSDWEPNTITSSQHQSGELLDPDSSSESRYESMYDKIKRRTNQSTAKSIDSLVKPDVFQRLLKNKSKEPKKPNSQKSLVDSDTDECLSDGSSIHSGDASNSATKRTTKTNSLSNEIGSKSVKHKVPTTSRAKSQAISSVSPKRKKIVTDSELSLLKEPSHKARGRKAKKSNISNKAQSLTAQVRRNHKSSEQQGPVTTLNYRSITRRKKPCVQEKNVPADENDGKVISGRVNLTGRSKTQKQKAISAVNKQLLSIKNTRRSLVHRVFASTDSSSLSSVISESSDDDLSNNQVPDLSVKEEVSATEITQESNYQPIKSKSPTLQLSRSCSPEDLRADAAIRHTFGAFTAPFICFKTDPSHTPAIGHNAPQSTDVNVKFSPSSEDSKPTPPTLPMTDSSFSGDQQSNGISAAKLKNRDHSDWNIFSSLAKQSTPIKDDNIHQNLSSASGLAAESNEIPVNSTAETSYDTEDELPSLEKHDDDEVSIPYESSILLHESDSLNNRAESLNGYNDDDLPPPVVSDIDHQLSYSDMPAVVGTVPDIIEEVIYDGLEVAVQDESHPAINKSVKKSDSCKNSPKSLSGSSPNVIESTVKTGLDQPLVDITDSLHIDLSSVTNNFSPNVLSPITLPVITSSSSSVSVQPTVFTPVSALHVTSQPSEVQTMNQSMLVTISSVSSTNLSPSNSALCTDEEASISQRCSSVQSSLNSKPQHHIAVVLPTTTLSSPGSSIVTVSSLMPESSTNVTTTSSVIKLESSPLSITCSSTTALNGQQLQNVTSHPPTTGITNPIAVAASLDNTAPTSHTCLSSVSQSCNTTFDPSDYTSYVQRVIERVKQEKDEEILQQREKMRRPKRNTSVSTPSMATSTTTNHINTSATVNCSGVLSPTPINLLNVAPIPTADVLKPPVVVNIDDKNATIPMCVANNSIVVQDSFSRIVKNVNSPNPQSANISEPPITSSHSQQLVVSASTEQNLYVLGCNNLTDDIHSRDPVDETIEAVVNGEFDEKEYVLKLSKGNFTPNGHCHTLSGSIGSPSSHPDIFTWVPDDSAIKSDYHQSGVSEAVCTRSNSSAVNICVDSSSTLSVSKEITDSIISMNHSSAVLTPMHVLTFVAAGAATSTSQLVPTSTAISPNVSSQSSSNLPTSTHNLPSISNPSSSTLDNIGSMTPLAPYTPILNSSNSLPTDSTNTRIEEFAARFANNPFTTYFYSLLTQKQLSPSLSPSISSADSICQRSSDNISLPICSSTKLKNLSIPNASVSGDTADYLAAATMAAMAAMTGPTQDMTSFGQSVASVSYSDSKPISSDNQFLHMSTAHLGIQEYSVIWRGRLSLKNEEVFVNMHYVSGNQDLLKSCMGVITEQQVALSNIATSSSSLGSCMTGDSIGPPHQPLKIVQRMRLEASQLEGVQRKLRQLNDFCMCLTLASAPPLTPDASLNNEQIRMNRILCDGFIKYMLEKGAAGIINVCHPCTQQNLYVIHIFPPCEFSRCQLQACAPALYHSLAENSIPHVLTVITTV